MKGGLFLCFGVEGKRWDSGTVIQRGSGVVGPGVVDGDDLRAGFAFEHDGVLADDRRSGPGPLAIGVFDTKAFLQRRVGFEALCYVLEHQRHAIALELS